jgi:hypothetical protein
MDRVCLFGRHRQMCKSKLGGSADPAYHFPNAVPTRASFTFPTFGELSAEISQNPMMVDTRKIPAHLQR